MPWSSCRSAGRPWVRARRGGEAAFGRSSAFGAARRTTRAAERRRTPRPSFRSPRTARGAPSRRAPARGARRRTRTRPRRRRAHVSPLGLYASTRPDSGSARRSRGRTGGEHRDAVAERDHADASTVVQLQRVLGEHVGGRSRRRRCAPRREAPSRSAYCAARVRSCIAATSVRPDSSAERVEELERLLLVADVERGGRLVEEHDRRLLRERARDDGALPLAAARASRAVRSRQARAGRAARARAGRPRGRRCALARERAEVRRAPEQHVLARPSSTAGVDGSCGTSATARATLAAADRPAVVAVERDRPLARARARRPRGAACVFPAPFGPISATHSPSSISTSTSSTTCAAAERHGDALERDCGHPPDLPGRPQHEREERRAEERGDDPDRDLGGRERRAGDRRRRARGTRRRRRTRAAAAPRYAAPGEQPDRVRDDDPDEARSARRPRRRPPCRPSRDDDEHEADAADVHAEALRLVVAEAEHVEHAAIARRSRRSRRATYGSDERDVASSPRSAGRRGSTT